jgi:hypothetical protein
MDMAPTKEELEEFMLKGINIPLPPGSKHHPLKRAVRLVDPKNNPTMIVGIPKVITSLADIEPGTELSVWMEKTPSGKTRVIYEKQ